MRTTSSTFTRFTGTGTPADCSQNTSHASRWPGWEHPSLSSSLGSQEVQSGSLSRTKSHCTELHLAFSLHKFCFNAGNWNHFNIFGCIHSSLQRCVQTCFQCWPPTFLIRNFCIDFGVCLYLFETWVGPVSLSSQPTVQYCRAFYSSVALHHLPNRASEQAYTGANSHVV